MAKENRSQEINDKSWGGSVPKGRTVLHLALLRMWYLNS